MHQGVRLRREVQEVGEGGGEGWGMEEGRGEQCLGAKGRAGTMRCRVLADPCMMHARSAFNRPMTAVSYSR